MNFYKRTKTYTVNEFLELQRNNELNNNMDLINRIIGNIKANKVLYAKVVFMTAIMLHVDQTVYANSFKDSMDRVGNLIVDMFMVAAKWGCIGMGFKNMLTTLLDGGNMKNAINDGILYILAFLFFQLYPQFFSLLTDIKF